jgi:hypothetical protein
MASHKKPGGGVKNGARAQEESLLDVLIYQNQLVIHYIHLIKMSVYTQNSIFFLGFNYDYGSVGVLLLLLQRLTNNYEDDDYELTKIR